MSDQAFELYVDSRFTSPWAMSVFVALTEKGLPFTLHTLDLDAQETRKPAFAKLSLTRRVPTLVHGDFVLTESSAITEYLETVHPAPALYPEGLRERAVARQLQAWVRSDSQALRGERSTEVIFHGARGEPLSADATAAAQKLFDVVEAVLPAGANQVFSHWSLVDLDLAVMLQRLKMHGDPVPTRLAAYADAQWSRPSVQAWLAHAATVTA